ncbi:hypothetical protein [cyanobacterium endosymbiont of Rhopalodia gibberula]|nr:hypothetical protein [cyanobacterium endosymbiont of Rhopalodia gibberula]
MVGKIHVHHVTVARADNFFHWIVNMNHSMGYYGRVLIQEENSFE